MENSSEENNKKILLLFAYIFALDLLTIVKMLYSNSYQENIGLLLLLDTLEQLFVIRIFSFDK